MKKEWLAHEWVKMTVESNDDDGFKFSCSYRTGRTWRDVEGGYNIPRAALVAWFGEEAVAKLEREEK